MEESYGPMVSKRGGLFSIMKGCQTSVIGAAAYPMRKETSMFGLVDEGS